MKSVYIGFAEKNMRKSPADKNLLEAIEIFGFNCSLVTIENISNGLINSSFRISDNKNSVFLQKLNKKVFVTPRDIVQNYNKIYSYLKKETNYFLPEPYRTIDKNLCFTDSNGNCWRALRFIEGTHTKEIAQHPEEAYAVAFSFGSFTHSLSGFDASDLKVIIPQFHDLASRFKQFRKAVLKDTVKRKLSAHAEVNELVKRIYLVNFYTEITSNPAFKLRVMHHDAKISNILFDTKNNKVICPVDFDTAQAGYFFSDLGDMIRTMACSHAETSTEFTRLSVRAGFYQAILEGYLAAFSDELTPEERKNIHYTGLLMTYMQALRFLTDYLNGDIYYRIDYPEQNFNRAKNQLILLEKLEEFLKANYGFLA